MTRPARTAVAIALTATLVFAAACSSGSEAPAAPDATATTTSTAPPPTPPATATVRLPAGPTSGPTLVSAFFLHGGFIGKGSAQPTEGPDGASAAMNVLLAGVTEVDESAGLTTAVPRAATLTSLTVADGVATIDFDRAFETANTQPQVAQVVFTLTQVEGVDAVQFLIDGEPNGATGVKPITRASLARFAPPAIVESPTPGQTVPASFPVSGTAATSGGTVTYRLEDPSGALLAEGSFVHGDDGTGAGPFGDTIVVSGYSGPAVLIMPAPAEGIDDASLTRIPIALQ